MHFCVFSMCVSVLCYICAIRVFYVFLGDLQTWIYIVLCTKNVFLGGFANFDRSGSGPFGEDPWH